MQRSISTTQQQWLGRLAVVFIAAMVTASAAANTYNPGYFVETWTVTGPANTSYTLEAHFHTCTWNSIMTSTDGPAGGTTDSAGKDSGWLGKVGPNTGRGPMYGKVRAVFDDPATTVVNLKIKKSGLFSCMNVTGAGDHYTYGVPGFGGGSIWEIRQNVPEFITDTGVTGWFADGSFVSITLPDHFTFEAVPSAQPIFPALDLVLGATFLEDGGRTLSIHVLGNGRIEPMNGILLSDVSVFYDGVGVPFEYRGTFQGLGDLTPADDPSVVLESGLFKGNVYAGTVFDPAGYLWFDETNGGAGFEDFATLQSTHDAWMGTTDDRVDFEMLPVGEKLDEQYLGPQGVFFSGAAGGSDDEDLVGLQPEGGPNVEDLTGYDGSYRPDGAQVYMRFKNTQDNPDAPLTIEFAEGQCKVAAFIACGKEGADHSFTITVSDGSGVPLDTKVAVAELWETDPAQQNCETLFAVESAIPNIRSVSIRNNSTVEFADVLIIDGIEFEWCVGHVPTDVNFDGATNFLDLLQVLSHWGPCQNLCATDVDGSGEVGFQDLLLVLSNWS